MENNLQSVVEESTVLHFGPCPLVHVLGRSHQLLLDFASVFVVLRELWIETIMCFGEKVEPSLFMSRLRLSPVLARLFVIPEVRLEQA